MRRLNASSAQSLCIFCACRLSRDPNAPLTLYPWTSHRLLSTTNRFQQQDTAAASTRTPGTGAHNEAPSSALQSTGFHASSSLSSAEQAERVRLRQARAEHEKQQREATEQRRKQQQEAAEAEKAKGNDGRTERKKGKNVNRGHQHVSTSKGIRNGKASFSGKRFQKGSSDQTQESFAAATKANNGDPWTIHSRTRRRKDSEGDGNGQNERSRQPQTRDRQIRFLPGDKSSHSRADNPLSTHSGQVVPSKEPQQPTRLGIPNFGHGSEAANLQSGPIDDGWGMGGVEKAPLKYGENVQVKEENSPTAVAHSMQEKQQGDESRLREGLGSGQSWSITKSDQDRSRPFDEKFSRTQSSYIEQRPPAHNDNIHNDNGYQAMPFNPRDYQQTQSRFDVEPAASWQHLRRRDTEHKPKQLRLSEDQLKSQTPHQPPQGLDSEAVDRIFHEHRQRRDASIPQQNSHRNPAITDAVSPEFRVGPSRVAHRRCGRCGELGHVARECTGPMRAHCDLCGQVGHSADTCAQNRSGNARKKGWRPQEKPQNADVPENANFRIRRSLSQPLTTEPFVENQHSQPNYSRSALRQEKESVFEDQGAVSSRRSNETDDIAAQTQVKDGEPAERMLRSRKFADEATKRSKASRRGREEDENEDEGGAARDERNARKAARKAEKRSRQDAANKARKAENGVPVSLPEFVSVATLAQTLGVRYDSFVERLATLGYDDVFPGKVLNSETSGMIAMEYNFEPVFDSAVKEAEERDLHALPQVEDKTYLPTRPPVVTIMGHVDHGKTTILDYLRKSSVAAGEAGGITQHIGAFSVPLAASGKTITFLDTPGHAAFLAMRERGAHVTDIVILVVAADDSVKPQTLEAIKHAKAAGVPMIVAVNKVDKEEADIQRVKQDLARHGVELEDFGGETQVVPVSGKTGQGMEDLEEAVVTLSEILDHRAVTDGAVEGWILEATTKNSGRVATILVRRGTLKQGTVIVAGKTWARVRTLRNESGQTVYNVGPGMPVEVDGWRDQPAAGDEVLQASSEQKASSVVEFRIEKDEREKMAVDMEAINEFRRLEQEKRERNRALERAQKAGDAMDPHLRVELQPADTVGQGGQPGGQMTVPFIIKADVSGSAEAVSAYIMSVSSPLIIPKILESAVGPVRESDVELAAAAQGHIIAFNLPADEGMKGQAASRGVKILENNIIYRVLEDVKAVLEDQLPPVITQKVVGEVEISTIFEIGVGGRKKIKIAGCKVRNGMVRNGGRVRVLRGGETVYDGTISSLKNVKKDVQEMRKGAECGMGFEAWTAFEAGDQVQSYEETSEKRLL